MAKKSELVSALEGALKAAKSGRFSEEQGTLLMRALALAAEGRLGTVFGRRPTKPAPIEAEYGGLRPTTLEEVGFSRWVVQQIRGVLRIETLPELLGKQEGQLLRMPGVGRRLVNAIKKALAAKGLKFGG